MIDLHLEFKSIWWYDVPVVSIVSVLILFVLFIKCEVDGPRDSKIRVSSFEFMVLWFSMCYFCQNVKILLLVTHQKMTDPGSMWFVYHFFFFSLNSHKIGIWIRSYIGYNYAIFQSCVTSQFQMKSKSFSVVFFVIIKKNLFYKFGLILIACCCIHTIFIIFCGVNHPSWF